MDVRVLKEFVAEVLTVCANDTEGENGYHSARCATWGLEEKAFQAGAELGMTKEEMEEIYQNA